MMRCQFLVYAKGGFEQRLVVVRASQFEEEGTVFPNIVVQDESPMHLGIRN